MTIHRLLALASLACLLATNSAFASDTPDDGTVLPFIGQKPQDRRLGPLKDLNGYFPFTPCKTPQQWAARAERLRRQVMLAAGLWPMPEKTPPRVVVQGLIDRDGYVVEKVILESYPGFFVTGNLYRPKGRTGRLPAVLCPHGHFPEGRFQDSGEKRVREAIVEGAERFEIGGRYPLQARCAQLARMGCIVVHYDMVGFADSVQLGHRPGPHAPLNTPERWELFSPRAESRLQTIMGLQTYNSIRALDWLASRNDVDPKRIGVTGESGGGTQTFILCAIDPRPAVAFPAVMVSTAMQGGCVCENASYLRIGTGNVEIAALIAPRPLGMTAANDWTHEIAAKGLPELKEHYRMLGDESLVMARTHLQFPHNFNYVARAVMYSWMNRNLKLGLEEPIVEEDFKPLSIAEMSVWDDGHPKPPSGPEFEQSLLRTMARRSDRQLEALMPHDAGSLARYREVVGGAVDTLIGRSLPPPGAIAAEQRTDQDRDTWKTGRMLLRYKAEGEELPAIVFEPKAWNRQVVVWISKEGKRAMFDPHGDPSPPIRKLLDGKTAVLGIDLFGQGEFTDDGRPWKRARLGAGEHGEWTHYAGYTYGYNYPLFVQRVHDVLSACSFARHGMKAEKVCLAGLSGAGHWIVTARAQAPQGIDAAVADTDGFRFANVPAIDDPDFLPGGAKYLDLPGMAALSAPGKLWLAGETRESLAVATGAYRAAGAADSLTLFSGPASEREMAAIEWLLREAKAGK